MRELNILITAASRRVPLIRAFGESLRGLGLRGKVITTDMDVLSPGLYFSDRHFLVPLTTDPQYIPIIRSICFRERIHLLIPTIDDELPLFGGYAQAFLATGVRVIVSGRETCLICNDKHKTWQALASRGLPAARTWLPGDFDPSNADYPLFLKPRTGRGSVGAHRINDEREMRFFLEYVSDPIVQEYLPGREFTIDVLCDFKGKVISVVPRERLVIRSGVSDRGRTVKDSALIDLGARTAAALGIIGPANIQVKADGDRRTIFEINPRFSGGIPLTLAAGADFPTWLLEMRLGRKVRPAVGKFVDGLTMACYESAVYLGAGGSRETPMRLAADLESAAGSLPVVRAMAGRRVKARASVVL